MRALVLAAGDTYVPPGVQSFNYPEILPGVTKPILEVIISVILVAGFWIAMSGKLKIVPGKVQFLAESFYDFTRNQIGRDNLGSKELRPYIPLLLTLFSFTLVNNVFGFIPFFQLPSTTHIAFPIGLAAVVYLIWMFIGIRRHGFLHYFGKVLFPPEVPKYVLPIYTPLELLSTFLLRPVTHVVRIFATMFAGHLMLLVFITGGEFLLIHASAGLKLVSPVAFLLAIALSFLELLIQVLQAYVFTVLTANYIGGALAEGH